MQFVDALPLDPGDYSGTYKLIGGRLALDFINTVSWPDTTRSYDWLSTTANLRMWFESVGLPAECDLADSDLDAVGSLRQTLADVIAPVAHGNKPEPVAISALNRHITGMAGSRIIDPQTLRWKWVPPTTAIEVLRPVVVDGGDLIASTPNPRIKHCPSCDWLFEDQTRNGKRRWCDMADCGSRAKSRDYYHRTKATD